MSQLPKAIHIREVGLREGFQTISKIIPTAQKLELLEALNHTGIKEIEITSLVRGDKVPQMADAEDIIRSYKRHPGTRYTALYLNQKGFLRGEQSKRLDNQAWLYTAVSETFLKKNNDSDFKKLLASYPAWLMAFADAKKPLQGLMVSTAFGCSYEGKLSVEQLIENIRAVEQVLEQASQKLPEICLADTMGWATPDRVKRTVAAVRAHAPHAKISLHLHDTRGCGIANAYAGLEEGVTTFDSSLGGLGGCPFARGASGNIATEELVFLCEEMGISTGVNLNAYITAVRLAERIVGFTLPGKIHKAIPA